MALYMPCSLDILPPILAPSPAQDLCQVRISDLFCVCANAAGRHILCELHVGEVGVWSLVSVSAFRRVNWMSCTTVVEEFRWERLLGDFFFAFNGRA